MAIAVVMPKQGNSVESCIIVAWKKKVGDAVAEGEIVCEVETDKALVEVESPAAGQLLALFFEEGTEVPVMTNIAAVGQAGENVDDLRPGGAPAPTAPATEPAPAPDSPPATRNPQHPGADRLKISPRARHLAEHKVIDVSALAGSGPGGRIIEQDVRAAVEAQPAMTPLARSMAQTGEFQVPPRGSGVSGRVMSGDLTPREAAPAAAQPVAVAPAAGEVEIVPVKGIRKVIAERMLQSLQTTAQLTLNAFADARSLQAYRQQLKASPDALGLQKVSINDLILLAVSRTLPQYPDLNALFTGVEIHRYANVHLGLAVDTPRGLMVPTIRAANRLSLKQISAEARRLAAACQEGKIAPDELSGGTFTVTNLGALGIETFTPVLNPPQVAILGVGGINLRPVQVGSEVQFIPHIGLSLTINHQVVDGAPAARFLQALSQGLANIELLLAL
ncbi:MAG: Dihydrolipoyllysine-residue acetyltransferase component of pyruvate dehydrogenase complex [Anaerolineae bacterium]|nr:Dihydrolipoyllysine-residue acetyltransferase component of pyruvate dehydrogenase complex [Anaerolineae bacterium]